MKIYANVYVKEIRIPRGYLQIVMLPNSLVFIIHFHSPFREFYIYACNSLLEPKHLHFYCIILSYFAALTFFLSFSLSLFSVKYPLLKSSCDLGVFVLLSFLPDFIYNAICSLVILPELSKLEVNPSEYFIPLS